jgi:hypothetical protein
LVIQANAAFLRYTGFTSSNVLGRPLSHMFSCENNENANGLLHALKESYETLKPLTLTNGLSIFNRIAKKAQLMNEDQCSDATSVVISPVGSKSSSISHFSIEVHLSPTNDNNMSSVLQNENYVDRYNDEINDTQLFNVMG